MKWIGQHIYDQISRFRDDVYLEDISSGTIVSGGHLGLDSNNKIVKAVDGGGDITGVELTAGTGVDLTSVSGTTGGDYEATIGVDVSDFMANGSDNRVVTATGADAMNAEANLTFSGSTLGVVGNVTIAPGEEGEVTALTITNEDQDQIALDIAASNTTADVINITADAVTTSNVIDISCDGLTTGSALKIEDNSAETGLGGARNIVDIYQKNTAADVAQALSVKSDGGQIAVLIDKNASGTAAQNVSALHVDLDRTVPGEGTTAHNDIGINLDVTSASLGTSTLKGMEIDVRGATSGASLATGIDLTVSGADYNRGIYVTSSDVGLRLINPTTSSATQGGLLQFLSDDGAAMGDDHRLGIIEFRGVDGGATTTVGASIEAFADAAWSTTENGGRLVFSTTDADDSQSVVLTLDSDKLATFSGDVQTGIVISAINTTTGSSSQGGHLKLVSDDGAAIASGHRLGTIQFKAAEDSSSTLVNGARIDAVADATWSASENGASLKFYTTDGDASQSLVLTLDSDKLATFTGDVYINNATTSSATEGGTLNLISDDGAALGDDHRLGKVGFFAAEDGSNTLRQGASIAAYADDGWSGTVNDTRLEFYTMDGDNGAELSLTLDSDLLATFAGAVTVTGDLTVNGDTVTFESANTDDPTVIIKNTTNDTQAARLAFYKNRTNTSLDNDRVAEIDFFGEDDGGNGQQYGKIMSQATDVSHGAEKGKISFQVAEYDGTLSTGLSLSGQDADGEVDVTVGLGAASVTTIAGTLTMGSTAAMTNAGLLSVANQTGITGLGTISSGVWEGTAVATDQQKHVMHYQTTGYAASPSNYEISKQVSTTNHPFQHDVDIGSDGLTAMTVQTWIRSGGHVMPRACTLKRWTGWAASNGTATTYIGLFKVTPTRNNNSDVSAVLLEEFSYTALGNAKMEDFDETSFTATAIAAGDIIFTAMKGPGSAQYFNGTFEVEF